MLNCYELNLPSLTNDTAQRLLSLAESLKVSDGFDVINFPELNKDITKWINFHKQTNTSKSSYIMFEMTPEFNSLIYQEMSDNLFPFSKVKFYFQLITGGDRLIPHRDPYRTISLIYNLSADNAATHWYNDITNDPDKYFFNADEISDPIQTIRMEPFKWYVFNNDKPHSVSEIPKNRIAITSRINGDFGNLPTFNSFVEQYEHLLVAENRNRT